MTEASPDISKRIILITGGNSGIGKETAVGLASMGAHIIITARNRVKGEAAITEIRNRSKNEHVELAELDLASKASIQTFVQWFQSGHDHLDVLINNAGLLLRKREETTDGFEMVFGVNHLGHFFLTSLLRDQLIASAPARVVTVSSEAHRFAGNGLDFDDLMSSAKHYRPFRTYARSKLANILFTRELARRLEGTGVTANSLHPGLVASNFLREGDAGLLGKIVMTLGRPVEISASEGALTSVFLASSPIAENISGQYFEKCVLVKPSAVATDESAAQRLWSISEELLG